jgi:hypothetical protein
LPHLGFELLAIRLQRFFLPTQLRLIATKLFSVSIELGFEFPSFALKLPRRLVEALPLTGLIKLDVVAKPVQLALLGGPFRLEFLGDAAALRLGLLAEAFELFLFESQPAFQFRRVGLSDCKLLGLNGVFFLRSFEIALGLADIGRCRFVLSLASPEFGFSRFELL